MSDYLSISEQISGAIAAGGCSLIVLTYIIFPKLRKLRYVELVFYVSLNDLIGSIGISLGKADTTSLCWFQAITTNMNYLSAILWTTVITIQVWLVVYYRIVLTDAHMRYIHLVCWGLPAIVTFLPLTTNTFGENDDQNPWCFIGNRASGSPTYGVVVWELFAFYIWVWASLLINVLLIISISLQLKRMAVVSEDITQTIRKLSLYPLILIFCWTGATVFDMYGLQFYVSAFDDITSSANIVATTVCISQGLLLTVAFFAMNDNVRKLWFDLLTCRPVQRSLHDRTRGHSDMSDIRGSSIVAARTSQFRCTIGTEDDDNDTAMGVTTRGRNNSDERSRADTGKGGSSIFEFADRPYASSEYTADSRPGLADGNTDNPINRHLIDEEEEVGEVV